MHWHTQGQPDSYEAIQWTSKALASPVCLRQLTGLLTWKADMVTPDWDLEHLGFFPSSDSILSLILWNYINPSVCIQIFPLQNEFTIFSFYTNAGKRNGATLSIYMEVGIKEETDAKQF